MGKKKYIKPEIRDESYILTVRAWVTTASAWASETNTNQRVAESTTSILVQNLAQNAQSPAQQAWISWITRFLR